MGAGVAPEADSSNSNSFCIPDSMQGRAAVSAHAQQGLVVSDHDAVKTTTALLPAQQQRQTFRTIRGGKTSEVRFVYSSTPLSTSWKSMSEPWREHIQQHVFALKRMHALL